jgi:2-polyprenyl-3-methyl-5-hydroxy-6-metoxy-1,4-benzoquinol methylase
VPVAVERMDAPLSGQSQRYDVIYCQEVLEHSHAPLSTAQYLLDHLVTGGTLVFDYMQSDGHGLDTPAGVEGRQETIAFLRQYLDIVHPRDTGTWDFQSLTFGIKRP